MFSLPIPSWDQEAFENLQHGDIDIASVVTGVTNGRMSGQNLIHLDPDLNFEAYRHRKERANWQHWRGMLGHSGVSKERTFESSFVIAVRQRRGKPKAEAPQPRKASSPPLTADIAKRKAPSTPNPTEIQERQRLETRREYDKRRNQRPERHQSARNHNVRLMRRCAGRWRDPHPRQSRTWSRISVLDGGPKSAGRRRRRRSVREIIMCTTGSQVSTPRPAFRHVDRRHRTRHNSLGTFYYQNDYHQTVQNPSNPRPNTRNEHGSHLGKMAHPHAPPPTISKQQQQGGRNERPSRCRADLRSRT